MRDLLSYLLPRVGWSPASAADGPSVFVTVGPLTVLVDLPLLRETDEVPTYREPSIAEINAAIRTAEAAEEDAAKNCIQN